MMDRAAQDLDRLNPMAEPLDDIYDDDDGDSFSLAPSS
jgi:hypothetical protein